MVDPKQLEQIEEALFQSGDWLRTAPAGPAVRELRVRYGSLVRVVASWKMAPPHPGQLAAMLECVSDLRGAIVRRCDPSPRDALRLARRSGRPSGPAQRPSAHPSGRPAARSATPPDLRLSMPSTRWPAAVLAIRPPPPPDVFQRTTRPPPRGPSEPADS